MHTVLTSLLALQEIDLGCFFLVNLIDFRGVGCHRNTGYLPLRGSNDDGDGFARRDTDVHLEFELRVRFVGRFIRVDHVIIDKRQPEIISFGRIKTV